ncbi:MAG: universal stress protein [Mogibacterium sp.]|nr:universal stress protein [Mogibacterium sp.]
MKRVLVPIDGSPRSLTAIEQIKATFSPKAFEIILLMVYENFSVITDKEVEQEIHEELRQKLAMIAEGLDRYQVIQRTSIGKPGQRIMECAQEMAVSMIVITRSTKTSHANTIGTTASYVIRHANCNVMIVKEHVHDDGAYRGLVYRKAKGTVNLRGQLSLKQSECLLPSVRGDVIYTIAVTRGRVRFLHRSYNSDTKEWDLPPYNGQPEMVDVSEGELADIEVNAEGAGKMLDRIRVVNRNMKTEAVFHYTIRRAKPKE